MECRTSFESSQQAELIDDVRENKRVEILEEKNEHKLKAGKNLWWCLYYVVLINRIIW